MASVVSEFIDTLLGSKHPGRVPVSGGTQLLILQLHQLTGIQMFWDEPFCDVALSVFLVVARRRARNGQYHDQLPNTIKCQSKQG